MRFLPASTPIGRIVPHRDAAREFGLDYWSLRRRARSGKLAYLQIGSHLYFDRRDLIRLAAEQTLGGRS